MIGSIGSSYANYFPPRLAELNQTAAPNKAAAAVPTTAPDGTDPTAALSALEVPGLSLTNPVASTGAPVGASFGDVLSQAVSGVNATMQTAEVEKAKVMSGETNNLHQAMLSMQEAGVAFSMMTEVRNKLVESYQEIMRMQV